MFVIYGNEKVERPISVRLMTNDGGRSVKLVTVDDRGNPVWYLLQLSKEGLTLNTSIPSEIGLPVDSVGRLKVRG